MTVQFSNRLNNHDRVKGYDTDLGESHFVILKPGFAFDDAHHTELACHTRSFRTVAEALRALKAAEPCTCERCQKEAHD